MPVRDGSRQGLQTRAQQSPISARLGRSLAPPILSFCQVLLVPRRGFGEQFPDTLLKLCRITVPA